MIENIAQDKYASAVDSYTSLSINSKIRGNLIEKQDKNIKVDIGNNNALEIELKEDIDIKPGETVVIDRSNIAKSKLVKLKEDIKLEKSDMDNYSDVLKHLNIDDTEENIKILKKLDQYGVEITKENLESYKIAKTSLDEIASSLDYDSAIKLVKMNIDIENESIQKIALSLEELEEEKEGFNLLKLFEKKELTTEQAEEIAKKVYGSRMGKDITDIIKSLNKKEVSITKKNIEKINDVFYKLDKLKDIEDETFIDTIKNKLDINIENLYRIKRYVKSEEIREFDNKNIINIKGYEASISNKTRITNRELKLLEEDIKDLISNMGLETSEENIKLSKEFIKRDMEVSKENITDINEMKEALKSIIKTLNRETAAQLVKQNIDIETEDIRVLVEKFTKKPEVKVPEEIVSEESKVIENNLVKVSEVKMPEEVLKEINQSVETKVTKTLEIEPTQKLEEENVNEIMKKIDLLKKVDEEDLLKLLEKNVDFKINKIEQVIFGKREVLPLDKTQDLTYSTLVKSQNILQKDITQSTLNSIEKISTAFKDIGKLDFNTIALQIKNNIPITIMNIQRSHLWTSTKSEKPDVQMPIGTVETASTTNIAEATKALVRNGISTTRLNIQKAMDVYRGYNNIRENLTSNMVSNSIASNIQIENIDINLASKYVDEYRKTSSNYETNKQTQNPMQTAQYEKEKHTSIFTESAYEITRNSDKSLMFLIKNKKPLSFRELQKTHSMFENKNQMGHKISEIADFIYENGDDESKQKVERLKENIIGISKNMKDSNEQLENAYNDMEESLKDIFNNVKFSHEENNNLLRKKTKEISETLEESKGIIVENKIIQLPIYMNGQFTNLNMYFRDREEGSSKMSSEDMSVVLSIDTENMGNLNISLDVDKKNINVKIGLENLDDKEYIESHKKILEDLLEQRGYSIGEITFYKEGEFDTFRTEKLSEEKPYVQKGNLDIKI